MTIDIENKNNEEKKKITLTKDQKEATDSLLEGNNVIVQAVAGSGKTTSSLMFAKNNPDKKFLILTYNNALAKDTRTRIEKMQLDNVWCFTLDSIANVITHNIRENIKNNEQNIKNHKIIYNHLQHHILNDNDILDVLFSKYFENININKYFKKIKEKNKQTIRELSLEKLDFLILDEVQDFTPTLLGFIFYYFLCNENLNVSSRLFILGDQKQNIYETFTQSSSDIIKYFDFFIKHLNNCKINNKDFKHIQYLRNFRSNEKILGFINDVFLNTKQDHQRKFQNDNNEVITYSNLDQKEKVNDNIKFEIYSLPNSFYERTMNWSGKDKRDLYKIAWIDDRGPSDEFRDVTKQMCKNIVDYVLDCVNNKKIPIEDIVIGRFSVNYHSLMDVRLLEKELYDAEINIRNTSLKNEYIENSDRATEFNNKLEITTIHKLKGREKKVVILFNFDHTAFKNTLMQDVSNHHKDHTPYFNFLSNLQYVALTRSIDNLYITIRMDNFNLPKQSKDNFNVHYGFGEFWDFTHINEYTNLDGQTSKNLQRLDKAEDNLNNLSFPNYDELKQKKHIFIEIEPSHYYKDLNDGVLLEQINKKISMYRNKKRKEHIINDKHDSFVITNSYKDVEEIKNDKLTTYAEEQSILVSQFVLSKMLYLDDNYKIPFLKLCENYALDIKSEFGEADTNRLNKAKASSLKNVLNKIIKNEFKYDEASDEEQMSFWALFEAKHGSLSYLQLPSYENTFNNDKNIKYKKVLECYDNFSKFFNLEYSFDLSINYEEGVKIIQLTLDGKQNKIIKMAHVVGSNDSKSIRIRARFDAICVKKDQNKELKAYLFEFKWAKAKDKNLNAYLCQVLLYLCALNEFHQAKTNQNKHLSQWFVNKLKKENKSFKSWFKNLDIDVANEKKDKWIEQMERNGYDLLNFQNIEAMFFDLLSFKVKEYDYWTYKIMNKILDTYNPNKEEKDKELIDKNGGDLNRTWFRVIYNSIDSAFDHKSLEEFKEYLKEYKKANLALFYEIENAYLVNYRTKNKSFIIENKKDELEKFLKLIRNQSDVEKLTIGTLISQLKNLKDKVGGFNWDLDTIQKEIEAKIQKENEENKDNEDNKINTNNLNNPHSLTNSQTDNFNQSIITKPKPLK